LESYISILDRDLCLYGRSQILSLIMIWVVLRPTFRKGTPVLILSVRGNLLDLLIEDKKYIWDIWMFEEAIEKSNE
jgi:hypothetical protein